jgi:PAS domain S-box-containing protein
MTDGKDAINGVERTLLESKENWKSLVENAPNMITMVDQNGIIKFINRTVRGLSKKEVIGKSVYDFVEPDYHEIARKSISGVFENGISTSFESRALGPNDTISWYDVQVGPIKQKDMVVAVSMIISDISHRKNAESALKESEERYKSLVESTFEGIAIHEDGKILEANSAFCKLGGYDPSEIFGMDIMTFTAPESKEAVIRNIKEGNETPMEAVGLRKDGTTFEVELVGKHVPYKGRTVRMTAVREISERKKAEDELKKSEIWYRSLIENSASVFSVVDAQGKGIYQSPSIEKVYGWTPEEVKNIPIFERIHPDDLASVRANFGKLLENPSSVMTQEVRYKHKNGSWRIIEALGANNLENPAIKGITITSHDITERKIAEQKLKESENRFRALFDQSAQFLAILSPEGNILEVNEKTTQLPGFTSTIIGKPYWDKDFWPDSPELWDFIHDSVMKASNGEFASFEAREVHDDILHVTDNIIFPVKDDNGGIIFLVAAALDITERKKAEKGLRLSEEKFSKTFHSSPNLMALFDLKNNKILEVNDQITEITGYDKEEIVGKRIDEPGFLIRSNKSKKILDLLEDVNRIKDTEIKIQKKNGEERFLTVSGETIEVGGDKFAVISGVDNTERKKAEEALQESEEKYRNFIEQSKEGLILLNEEGIIIEWNNAQEVITGMDCEEALGRPFWDILVSMQVEEGNIENRMDELKNMILDGIKKGKAPWIGGPHQRKIRHKDGTIRFIESLIFPISTSKGLMMGSINRDITERKNAEEALRESEEKFRNIVQSSPMGMHMYQLEPDNRLVFTGTNPAADKILGVDNQQFVGKTIEEAFAPLKETDVPKKYRLAAEKGEGWDTEQIDYEDEKIKGAFEVHAFQTSQDKMVTLFMDITKRKQTEMKLKESEEKFRMFFQNQPEYCYMISSDGIILDVNKSALETLGYEKDELIGKSLNTIYAPENYKEMEELYEKWKKTGNLKNEEITIISKSGERRHVLLSAESISNESGSLLYSLSVQRDITERKKVEEALRESESFLSESQKIAHVGSWSLDLVNNQLTWSDEVYRIFGEEPQEFDATYEAFLEMVHPEDRTAVDAAYADSLREGRDSYEIEHRVVRKHTGEIRTVHEKCIHLRDETNTIVRSVGMVQDITERERAEEALKVSEEKYRDLVENINDVIYIVNKEGKVTYISPVIERSISGFSVEEILGTQFNENVYPEDLDRVNSAVERIMSGNNEAIEYRAFTKSGEVVWVRDSCRPIIKDGNVEGFQGVLRDITDSKMAQEQTRIQRDLGQSLIAQTDLGEAVAICIDTAINASGMDSGGAYLVDESTGDLNLIYSKGLSSEFIKAASHYDAESPNTQLVMSGKPSYVIYSELQLSPNAENIPEGLRALAVIPIIHEKNVIGCLNIASHTTGEISIATRNTLESIASQVGSTIVRLQAEEALRASEDRYRTISNLISDFVYSISVEPDGTNISEWSTETLEKVIGMNHAELLDRGGWKNVIHPDDLPIVIERQQLLASGKSDVSEYRVISKDGDVHWVRDYANPIWNEKEGRIIRILGAAQDITKRKLVEEALRESEEKYRELVENIDEVIYRIDLDGEVNYVSPSIEPFIGYKPSEIMGRPLKEFIYGEDLERVMGNIRSILSGNIRENEYRIVTKSGDIRWIHTSSKPIISDKGVTGLQGILSDITERKKAEGQLQILSSAVEQSANSIAILDKKGMVTYVNSKFIESSQLNKEEVMGKHWGTFVSPQSTLKQDINEIRDTVLTKGEVWKGEISDVLKDGKVIWRTSTLFPIKDEKGEIERTVYISEDITERKRAEKALIESKERFLNLSDLLPEAVFEVDMKGTVTFANKRAFEMFGYTEKDFKNGLTNMDMFPQKERKKLMGNIKRILGGENLGVNEYVAIKKDGIEFPVLIHSNAIIQEGKPIGLRGIIVDITTRKKTETEREILFRELKHRVKNNLQLLSSMVDMQIMRSDDPKLKSKLQETQSVIDTIALIYSRAYEGTEMAGLNLNIFIEELLNGLMKFKTNNELIIDYTILGDKIKLSTDTAIPMALIANELVFNSLKHAFKDRKTGKINIILKDEKDTITMTISDDGIGLDPKIDLDKPDSFGLKIVNNLTNQLSGTIETNLENGTEFVLRVPKVD